MNKVLIIGAGDELSSRSQRLLAMLNEQYPEIEVERMNIKDHTQWSGHNWEIVAVDEYSDWTLPVSKRKPKPFYRQGERW